MIRDALDSLLSMCFHRLGFPFTPRGSTETYVKCTQCSAKWEYDWFAMKRGVRVK